jgi:hypothetical protein
VKRADDFTGWKAPQMRGVTLDFPRPGKPRDNAYVEHLQATADKAVFAT